MIEIINYLTAIVANIFWGIVVIYCLMQCVILTFNEKFKSLDIFSKLEVTTFLLICIYSGFFFFKEFYGDKDEDIYVKAISYTLIPVIGVASSLFLKRFFYIPLCLTFFVFLLTIKGI